ncbi:MAG: EamA family transporter [Candidatus Rokubacteria bacterium]|nr:EamA family transporter [Candidatus Rokubacteria bacterium]MBI2553363.1 EamA family transporter [Candidatus Rokubacteria bacterium]
MADRLDARAVSLMVLLTAIWGGSYTFVKVGFRDLPVFASLFLRMVVATAILLIYSAGALECPSGSGFILKLQSLASW